jgi:hypothetical protein
MEVVRHHDEFMKKKLLLVTLLKEGVEEQECHSVRLEHRAAPPGGGGGEVGIGPGRCVITRRFGHGYLGG